MNTTQITPVLVTLHRRFGDPIMVNMALSTKVVQEYDHDAEGQLPYTVVVFLDGQPTRVQETPEEVATLTQRAVLRLSTLTEKVKEAMAIPQVTR